MNNKGFIATSLVYSFFLVLMVMIIAILSNFVTNKTIQERYNDVIKEDINNIEVKFHLYVLGIIETNDYRVNPDISVKEKKTYLNGAEQLGITNIFGSNTTFSYKVTELKTNEDFSLTYNGSISNANYRCVPEVTVSTEGSSLLFSNIRSETLCYIY